MSRPILLVLLAAAAVLAVLSGWHVVDGPSDELLEDRRVHAVGGSDGTMGLGDAPSAAARSAGGRAIVAPEGASAMAPSTNDVLATTASTNDVVAASASTGESAPDVGTPVDPPRPLRELRTAHVDGRVVAPRRAAMVVPHPAALAPADLQRRLRQGAAGTYIDALVRARDSLLMRWPDRLATPIRVYVEDAGRLDGWQPGFAQAARDAFERWGDASLPIRFAFVRTDEGADVVVRFIESFPDGMSGKTVWSRDTDGWIVSGDITLALLQPSGDGVTPDQLRAIALHEIGHLLGLDHVDDVQHIMAPRIRVRDLSEADVATMRLLYSVPAGALR